MLRPRDRLGPYEIVEHLRAGGMASLYRARRVGPAGFAREVAIKIVHPHLSLDPAFVRMFVDEARLSVRVRHTNVVRVEELGEEDGTYYLVMELLHGRSLSEVLAALDEPLEASLAVQIAVAVADGLHAAHETRGEDGAPLAIVHRDVSPKNVLLGRDGHVTLIDFGIARARGRAAQTASGELRGTLRYMAPEQLADGAIDRRADLWALGVMLWQMLAGNAPFDASSDAAVIAKIHAGPPAVMPFVDPGLDPAERARLEAVVRRALSPRPGDRHATARELRTALVEALPRAALLGPAALERRLATLIDAPASPSAPAADRDAPTAPRPAPAAPRETAPRAEEPASRPSLAPRMVLASSALALVGGIAALSMMRSPAPSAPVAPVVAPASAPAEARPIEPAPAPIAPLASPDAGVPAPASIAPARPSARRPRDRREHEVIDGVPIAADGEI